MSLCHPCAWSTVRAMFHMSSKFDVSLTNCHRGLTVRSEGRDKFTNVGRVFDACSSHQNMVGCFGCGKITQWMHCNRGPATTPLRRGWWQESKHICHRWQNNLRINPSCQSVAPYCITSNSYLKRNEKLDINPCNVSETEMSESISYRVILHFRVPAKIKGLRLMAVTAACQQGAAGMSCFDFQKLVGQPHLYWVPLLKTSMQQRIEY